MFHLYGMFIGIAIVLGYSLAEKLDLRVSKIAPWVIGAGILGARIYHVLEYLDYYSRDFFQILAFWRGGMSIWGAIIGGILALFVYFRGSIQKVIEMASVIVTVLPLSQAVGRIGNGVNGEFVSMVWKLPWWSAEMILDLLLFGLMWGLHVQRSSSWVKLAVYLTCYAMIRYFLQPFR